MKIKSTKIPYKPELIDEDEFKKKVIFENEIKNIDDKSLKDFLINVHWQKNPFNLLADVIRGYPYDLPVKGIKDSETLKDIDRRIKDRETASYKLRNHDKYFEGGDLNRAGDITLTPNFEDYDFEKGEFGSDELDFLADGGGDPNLRFDRLRKKLK